MTTLLISMHSQVLFIGQHVIIIFVIFFLLASPQKCHNRQNDQNQYLISKYLTMLIKCQPNLVICVHLSVVTYESWPWNPGKFSFYFYQFKLSKWFLMLPFRPKARRCNKINTTHHVPTLTLQYIVTTDAATRSLHNFPMPNVGSGRRAESPHKKRRMNAFTKLRKPP